MDLLRFICLVYCFCSILTITKCQPDFEQPVIVCGELKSTATETVLFEKLFLCIPSSSALEPSVTNCQKVSRCAADAVMVLANESSEYEPGEQFSSRATAAFILVETLRKYFSASLVTSDHSVCDRKKNLQKIIQVCAPDENVPYYGFDSQENDPDPKLVSGYDILIKAVSKNLGSSASIAEEMVSVHKQKLWHGLVAIIFTFTCPGIMAVFSPVHFQIISVVQLLGMALIFMYVMKQVGILYAIVAVSVCVLIFAAQCILVVYCSRNETRTGHEHRN